VTGGGGHIGLVAAFLSQFGVVTVEVDGETYAIVDIGMRMLSPRELANCQGFPASYVLTGTQRDQIARVGNSVPPALAAAVIGANMPSVYAGAAE
jgi:DNA (cytosine-5)-methyltransferase 1